MTAIRPCPHPCNTCHMPQVAPSVESDYLHPSHTSIYGILTRPSPCSSVLLASMPTSSSTLGTVTIAPCSTFFVHSHPRSDELSHVTSGECWKEQSAAWLLDADRSPFQNPISGTSHIYLAPAILPPSLSLIAHPLPQAPCLLASCLRTTRSPSMRCRPTSSSSPQQVWEWVV